MTDPRTLPVSVTLDIDLDATGKHTGRMRVPYSRDDAAWGSILIPIISVKNGDGPVILITAGNHGDEYEGQLALIELARNLSAEDVTGQVIMVPHLNYPAVVAGTRTSPLDSGNLNRVFPGHPEGNVTQKIAHFTTVELIRRADVVLDMHSGGKTLDFIPCTVMHQVPDPDIRKKTLAALEAFGAPISMILGEVTTGMLDNEVERSGKIFISTELGGLGTTTAERMAITRRGVKNVLRHFEILKGDVEKSETRFMDISYGQSSIISYDEGMIEFFVDLGEEVKKGDPLARVWFFQDPEREPRIYEAPRDGLFYARHAPGLIKRGDDMAYIAADFDPGRTNQ